jgi:hypothetical protein
MKSVHKSATCFGGMSANRTGDHSMLLLQQQHHCLQLMLLPPAHDRIRKNQKFTATVPLILALLQWTLQSSRW